MFNRVRFWSCPKCRKERLMYFGLFLLIFIVPVGLYSMVKWDPIISRGSEGETITLGAWIITILWWAILGIVMYYKTKIFRKNHLIKELEEKFELIDKLANILKSKQEKHNYHDFSTKNMIDEVKDSINYIKKEE
ncbi:MAG: hypothetical protein WC726_01015 [Parcubacteria group bacterium]